MEDKHQEEKTQYLYGMHPVLEAVRAGRKFDKVLLKKGLEGSQFRELMQLLTENELPYQFVPGEVLDRKCRGSHQGVMALVARIDYVDIDQFIDNALGRTLTPLVMILDGVSDVRNLGAIARSLEVAGGQGIIVPAKGGAAINAEAVKASAGALMRIDTCKVSNLRLAIYSLRQAGFKIVASSEKADMSMYEADLTGPVAIIMGSEGTGISKSILSLADQTVSIPQQGQIGSLNVSVASAIMAFEAVRQRLEKR